MFRMLISIIIFPILIQAVINLRPFDEGSTVRFAIKNFGGNVTGSFKGLAGRIVFDTDKIENSVFDVTIDVNSINSGIKMRDTDLKKEKYFHAEKYPLIRLTSSSVKKDGAVKDGYIFNGTVVIKGIKKEISFPFNVTAKGQGYLFKGTFPLNRRDFNVGGSSISLSDNLTVTLAVLAKQ